VAKKLQKSERTNAMRNEQSSDIKPATLRERSFFQARRYNRTKIKSESNTCSPSKRPISNEMFSFEKTKVRKI
jgi:hypothetical protein